MLCLVNMKISKQLVLIFFFESFKENETLGFSLFSSEMERNSTYIIGLF